VNEIIKEEYVTALLNVNGFCSELVEWMKCFTPLTRISA